MIPFLISLGILFLFVAATLLIARATYKLAFYSVPNPDTDYYQLPDNEQYRQNKKKMYDMIHELEAIPFEPVTVISHDGLRLYGRYYHVTDGAPIHIEMHGYRGMAMRDFCGGDRIVRSLKHNTLLIDQRAHGKSEGNTITFGIKERLDCLTWINYLIERFGTDTPVFLIGVSMGAGTVLMATELSLPDNVRGVIADCPFSSPWEIISKVAKGRGFPTRLAYPFVLLGARLFGGFDLNGASAVEAVKHSRVPILLVHGEADHFVPCDMSRAIAAAAPKHIRFITVPEAGHGLSYIVDEETYTKETVRFIYQCLSENPIRKEAP